MIFVFVYSLHENHFRVNNFLDGDHMSSYFAIRLKTLRQSRTLTQKQMAQLFELTERGYQNYEIGKSTPNVSLLTALADYFDVSLDYLLGRTDDPKLH